MGFWPIATAVGVLAFLVIYLMKVSKKPAPRNRAPKE
jgi:hypothetical protein